MVSSRYTWVEICRATAILGLCGTFLVGCSNKTANQSASQVVAHVGNEDVTAQELENEFRLANVPADKQKDPAIIKQVMSELVLRHYLMQQAVTDKLDREPGVLLDIMRARAQVLATAYLSRTVAAKPITQEDVDKYIASNPLKFADRQLLSVEQVIFPIGQPKAQAAIDASKDLKSLDQVDQELSSMSIPHNRVMGSLSTAEIPEQLFKVIQAKKAEDVFFVRSGQNGVFFKVVGEEPRPLSGDQATNLARQFIRADQFKAEVGAATTAANLEAKYEGDYAGIMKTDNDTTPGGKK